MAGISFELEKIYKKKTLVTYIQGSAYAAVSTVGPMLTTISILIVLERLLYIAGMSTWESRFCVASLTYAFILATVIAAVFSNIVSRYISDCLYLEQLDKVGASIFGVVTSSTAISSIVMLFLSMTLYLSQDCSITLIIAYYIFGVLISNTYCMMIYSSTLKYYKELTLSYIGGLCVALLIFFVCTQVYSVDLLTTALLCLDGCFFLIFYVMLIECVRTFGIPNADYFAFLKYFKKYPKLLVAGVTYTISVYTPTIVYWCMSVLGEQISIFRVAPVFDTAIFKAILINSISMIIFVIKVEAAFYEKYSQYVSALNHGTYAMIEKKLGDMIHTLMNELMFIYKIQSVITASVTYLFTMFMVASDTPFNVICLSGILNFWIYSVFCSNLTAIIYYYFADYGKASRNSIILLILTIISTIASVLLNCYYPVLLLISGVTSWLIAILMLKSLLKDINRTLICYDYKD